MELFLEVERLFFQHSPWEQNSFKDLAAWELKVVEDQTSERNSLPYRIEHISICFIRLFWDLALDAYWKGEDNNCGRRVP